MMCILLKKKQSYTVVLLRLLLDNIGTRPNKSDHILMRHCLVGVANPQRGSACFSDTVVLIVPSPREEKRRFLLFFLTESSSAFAVLRAMFSKRFVLFFSYVDASSFPGRLVLARSHHKWKKKFGFGRRMEGHTKLVR